jgi:hypothetical protein
MLTYDTVKALKDAGFPQVWPQPDFLDVHDALEIQRIYSLYPKQFDPYRPSLSQLIEACGEKFGGLIYHPDYPEYHLRWEAYPMTDHHKFDCSSSNPLEAVANLWLAINKK